MTIAIVYISKHGATKEIAQKIQTELESAKLISLTEDPSPTLDSYDAIILGAPYYMGTLHTVMNSFVAKYEQELLKKPLGLFVCGMANTPKKQAAELDKAYIPALHKHAAVKAFMGGRITASQLNVSEKMVVRMVTKKPVENLDTINIQTVNNFTSKIKQVFSK